MADSRNHQTSSRLIPRFSQPKKKISAARLADRVLFMGFGGAVAYWIFASLLGFLTTTSGTLAEHFFSPGLNDLSGRLLVLFFFMLFSAQVGRILRQRQALDEALAGSEEKHRTIIENIEDGYYEIDRDGKLIIFNDAFRKISGYALDQLEMQDYRRLLTPAETDKVFGAFDRVRRTGKAIKDLAFVMVRKDGARRWVETSVSPIIHTDGEFDGYRGILRDVTRRRQADALKQEKMAAEAASRSKSEFLANMSHEIRTPLNAIIGLVELLLESPLSGEQREDLKVVQSAAYALLSVINDILDFSKIEAGKLELEKSSFNLRDFLGEALKILAVRAHEKKLELAYRVAPDVPDRLIGDHHRFRQVLLNLIGNAVKFTDAGEVVVFAQRKSLEDGRLVLHLAVRDTGAGIPAGKQALIFEAFSQADGSTTRKYGGTGLGLAVSAQLVNLMGGRIWVKSVMGKGSIFHFTVAFDVEAGASTGIDMPTEIDLSGLEVLVVDDNATNLKILCEMLSSWKMVPRAASSAKAAMRLMEKLKRSGRRIDLALIDADLPDAGAMQLARQVRHSGAGAARITLMLTTTSEKDAREFSTDGIATLVTKPVRPSDLLDAIIRALTARQVPIQKRGTASDESGADSLPPLDILVAEDTPFNQKYIKRLLDGWGCRTTIVENGNQAISAVEAASYDLVLMDVQMPEMDGLTATSQIRAREQDAGRHVPIIAMTAHAMKGDRERCIDAGMDDYVPKPISSVILLEAIRRVIPEADAAKGAAVDREDAPAADPAEDESATLNELLRAFNNDGAFFKEVAEMFISDYPPMLTTVEKAIAETDAELLGRTAHALKGMARNFQVDAAAEAALELEQLARAGAFDRAAPVNRRLSTALTRFRAKLERMVGRLDV